MTDEQVRELRDKFPGLTEEEVMSVPVTTLLSWCITNEEKLIKSYKEMLQDVFKNGKSWGCPDEELEWYKNHLRESKNNLEVMHKQSVKTQILAKLGIA